ncbi:MAG TPA: VOC family protein [bacterium]|nr:VOC family protein [bacterium]
MTQRIQRIYESALYVDDMERATAFYRDILGLEVVTEGPRLTSLSAGGGSFLLLFKRGASINGIDFPGGRIPPHDGQGPIHLALAIRTGDLAAWKSRLATHSIEVESEVTWPGGGQSLYFRDPDGHSVELATPGIWGDPAQ